MIDNNLIDRIITVINEKSTNPRKFAGEVGFNYSTLNSYINGRRSNIDIALVSNIISTFDDINAYWLLTGKGAMKNEALCARIEQESDYNKALDMGMKLIPEVAFKFAAGDRLIISNDAIVRYWGLPDCTGEECVVTVDGLSMSPIIPPGAKVLLKPIGWNLSNPNTIPFGEVFGVIVEDDCTGMYHGHIKKLRRHKTQPDKYWIAQSFNPEFDDFDITLNNVRGLWVVKKHIVDDFK